MSGKLIIVGDFNIHIDAKVTESSHLLSLLDSFGLTQHVSGSTHIKGHTLDVSIQFNSNSFICNNDYADQKVQY